MDEEPKSPAELKEIRLNRRRAQEVEGVKAMAEIAAADVAIRKRTEKLRAMRLAKEAADRENPPEPVVKEGQEGREKRLTQMTKEDRDRAQARADKVTRAAHDARSGKIERDASAKAVLDNMAKLKALRLAREAAEPQRAPVARAAKKAPASTKRQDEKPVALSDWLASQQNGGRRT